MTVAYERIKEYRQKLRLKILKCFNEKCGICNYNKCTSALEFHHIDPTLKEFSIKSYDVNNYEKIVNELRKCVCVCSNCHKEIHNHGLIIPKDIYTFNEEIAKSEFVCNKKQYDACPTCGKQKYIKRKFCSLDCYVENGIKIDWNQYDLYDLVCIKKLKLTEVAKLIGTSDNNVRKRLKRLKLPITKQERKDFISV